MCHVVCHCPLQQGHWLQKNVYVFLKRCSDIFAKLCKPFELTLLPEEVVLLLVLVLSFPSLSLLWVMGQQDLAAGDRVHNDFGWQCQLVQFLREQQWWLAVTWNSGWHSRRQTVPGLIAESRDNFIPRFFYGMTTALGCINGPTHQPCHLSRPDKSRCLIQNLHNEFTVFLWHCLPAIYASQRLSEVPAGPLHAPYQNRFYIY